MRQADKDDDDDDSQVGVMFDTDIRTIWLSGEIGRKTSNGFLVALSELEKKTGPIRIILNSEGGAEADGYAIYDAIRGCFNHVIIETYGRACSIAAIIFQAGDIRRISENSHFMIHNGSVGEGAVSQDLFLVLAERIKTECAKYYRILSERSGTPVETIEKMCREETYLDPPDVIRYGFADEIIKQVPRDHPLKLKSKGKIK